jgi:hypothetical protein
MYFLEDLCGENPEAQVRVMDSCSPHPLEGEKMRLHSKMILGFAVAGIAGIVSSAQAALLSFGGYTGQIYIKYDNVDIGKLYPVPPGQTVGGQAVGTSDQQAAAVNGSNNSTLPGSPDNTEDFWGLALVDEIREGDSNGALLYQRDLLNQGQQLTAMFVKGRDIAVNVSADGTQETVASDSEQVGFFSGPLGSYNIAAGPGARTNVGGVPQYPGVNGPGSTLIWSFVGAPGVTGSDSSASFISQTSTTLGVSAQVGALVGSGAMFLDAGPNVFGTGALNNLIADGGTSPDMTVQFTVRQGDSGWLTSSADPAITTIAVPEPTTLSLLGALGVMGMSYRPNWRRRRTA